MKKMILALVSLVSSGAMAAAVGPVCVPGTHGFVTEQLSNGRYVESFKECLSNGRYYADQQVTIRRCAEGTQAVFSEIDISGRYQDVTRTCVNGAFYPRTTPQILTCKEGSQAIFSQIDVSGRYHDVTRTCTNGKWR